MVSRTSRSLRKSDLKDNSPSPVEIQEMTAEIRRNWTARERRRRSGLAEQYVEMMQMPLQTRRKGFWGDIV